MNARWLIRSGSLLLWLAAGLTVRAHTFTDTQGRSMEAEVVAYDGGAKVKIRRSDGQVFDLPLNRLSPEDQAYVREWQSANASGDETAEVSADEIARINGVFGVPLFADGNLWDDSADEVAQRLGWPKESETATQSSFRKYNGETERLLGARPYSSVLYGQNGKVESISIVFANKGDSAAMAFDQGKRGMEKAVNDAIGVDGEAIAAALSALGEPRQETTATGRNMKERLQRWDWQGHAILLAVQEGEYVAVRIMPRKLADNRGRPERVPASELKAATRANVERRPNGDVVIKNIPMVDQGPKGYCVPATLERCLRYMGVSADMYLLAMAGQTSIGGGTYVDELLDGTEKYVKSAGRDMEEVKLRLSAKSVAKYIDEGQPLMWALFSTPGYNAMANAFTEARQNYANADDWAKALKGKLKGAEKLEADRDSGHVCLIIGYNEETNEIAVSDSWGPQYTERWIPAEQAQNVSQGSAWVVGY